MGSSSGSEAMPETLPLRLPADKPIVRKPVFAIRGVLPWYNFFDSPTTWDPIDHRAVHRSAHPQRRELHRLPHLRQRAVCRLRRGRQDADGRRLLNTGNSTLGHAPDAHARIRLRHPTSSSPTSISAPPRRSRPTIRNAAIRREQDVVRDALDYAKRRGVHTCIGFEVNGDPTNAATSRRLSSSGSTACSTSIRRPTTSGSGSGSAQGGPATAGNAHARPLKLLGEFRRQTFRRGGGDDGKLRKRLPRHGGGPLRRVPSRARLEQFGRTGLSGVAPAAGTRRGWSSAAGVATSGCCRRNITRGSTSCYRPT